MQVMKCSAGSALRLRFAVAHARAHRALLRSITLMPLQALNRLRASAGGRGARLR